MARENGAKSQLLSGKINGEEEKEWSHEREGNESCVFVRKRKLMHMRFGHCKKKMKKEEDNLPSHETIIFQRKVNNELRNPLPRGC